MNVICFHNVDEENGYLSNWYPSPFTLHGVDFSSMEQYMMYRKAIWGLSRILCNRKNAV